MQTDNECSEKLIADQLSAVLEPTISTNFDQFMLALIPDSSCNFCKLTPTEIICMTNLLKDASGSIVTEIQKTIQDVVKDGNISLHDIPELVLLITQLFQSKISIKNINIIKYTLDALLEHNLLPIPQALQSVSKSMFDTALRLLNSHYLQSLPAVE